MQRLVGFDGIRALACLMVIFHHLAQRMSPEYTPEWLSPIIKFLISGSVGVSVFFVLSGALLSYPFWKAFINKQPMPKVGVYFLRRFARIAPAFYISLTVSFILAFTVFNFELNSQLIIRYLTGLFFVNEFHPVTFFPTEINGPLWSIGFEVFSYVILFVVMLVLFRVLKSRKFTDALYYLVFIFFLTLLIHVIIYFYMPLSDKSVGWQYGLIGGARYWMPGYNVISLFSHFFFGIVGSALMVYLVHKKQKASKDFDIFIFINWLFYGMYVYSQNGWSFFEIPYHWPFFPILIAVTLVCLPFTTWVGKILDNRLFVFTAKISFGLYIWHFLVISLLQHYVFKEFNVFQTENLDVFAWAVVLTLVFSYIIASISYYLIESPIQKWSQKRI
ncbi:MAG: acyltransferase [Saccharospirillaceae bacterium]|nr:acyltransferase [Pseudomonadales bacterium]NRB78717.1 acyltransferase [Saccharospirillaceae bacterium]